MKKTLLFKPMLLMATLVTITVWGCKKNDNPNQKLNVTAKVINAGAVAADGCGWLIMLNDSTRYSPTNLEDKYKENDLDVVLSYKTLDTKFSCGWGAKVDEILITGIRKK